MTGVSIGRLYALRAGYLLIAAGLAVTIWPTLISHGPAWPLMNSVVGAMLGALSLMAFLGLRYPLEMLPILLFELTWKTIWLSLVALPLWTSGQLDERTMSTAVDCLVAVVLIPIVPWRYVIDRYARAPGAPWRRGAPAPEDAAPAGRGDWRCAPCRGAAPRPRGDLRSITPLHVIRWQYVPEEMGILPCQRTVAQRTVRKRVKY